MVSAVTPVPVPDRHGHSSKMERPTPWVPGTLSSGQAVFATLCGCRRPVRSSRVYNGDSTSTRALARTFTATVNKSERPPALGTSVKPVGVRPVRRRHPQMAREWHRGPHPQAVRVTFKDGTNTLSTVTLKRRTGHARQFVRYRRAAPSPRCTIDTSFNTKHFPAIHANGQTRATPHDSESSATNSVFGQSVTLTATVSPVAPGAGTRHGTSHVHPWTASTKHRSDINGSAKATFSQSIRWAWASHNR